MIQPIKNAPRFGVSHEGEAFRIAEIVTTRGEFITWPERFSHPHAAIRHLLAQMECELVKASVDEREAVRLSINLAPRLSTYNP